MRVILVHNATAGSEDHSAEELMDDVRRAGHDLVGHVTHPDELPLMIRERTCDVVAVAGGDGTVGAVAQLLVGTSLPLAVIPVGTANNIARTMGLGSDLSAEEIMHSWRSARVVDFDAATAMRHGRGRRFFEAFGFGAFPQVMIDTEASPRPDDPDETLERDRKLLRTAIAEAAPRAYTVQVDGIDHSGDYVLVEIMNIPYIGPGISVAPHADTGDGLLDVVLIADADRRALVDHFDALARGDVGGVPVRSLRATSVRIATADDRCHHDGELGKVAEVGDAGHGRIDVEIVAHPAALRVLSPT